jgi:hypothetical protein
LITLQGLFGVSLALICTCGDCQLSNWLVCNSIVLHWAHMELTSASLHKSALSGLV